VQKWVFITLLVCTPFFSCDFGKKVGLRSGSSDTDSKNQPHDGDESGLKPTEESERPTDNGEGIPGYLVDPERIEFTFAASSGDFRAEAPSGVVESDTGDASSVLMSIWRLESDTADPKDGEISLRLMAKFFPNEDGSFIEIFKGHRDSRFLVFSSTPPGFDNVATLSIGFHGTIKTIDANRSHVAYTPIAKSTGYYTRGCGFDGNQNGVVGEVGDCQICDGEDSVENELYVDSTAGNDAAQGTADDPLRSVSTAFSRLASAESAAQKIICLYGDFTESLTLNLESIFRIINSMCLSFKQPPCVL